MKQLEKARKYEELYKELFDRNSKVTTICLLLCGAFWVLKLYVLSEQCLILFFFSGGLYGVRRIHREHVQLGEYYLPDQLRTSSICNKVLYKGNVIPVSRANVIDVWILVCCLGAATLLLWIECIFSKDIEGTPALIMFYGIVPVICLEYISGFRTVHRRLKRLTWKNFRYHIGWCNIGEKLPKTFQSAEFTLEHGFCDAIVPRGEMKQTLTSLLSLHWYPVRKVGVKNESKSNGSSIGRHSRH